MRKEKRCLHFFFCMISLFGIAALFSLLPRIEAGMEQEKEPVRSTQSGAVPVTKELLKREGDLGPASPTFKMSDTSRFMVRKPYEKPGEAAGANDKEGKSWWESWFSWLDTSHDNEGKKNETR